MELWNAYDADGNILGFDLVRGETVPDGVFHLVCNVIVRHIDGSYLIMRRDYNKTVYPGGLEASAGGSVLKGEDSYSGALRELREETGITSGELTLICTYIKPENHCIYHNYLFVTDQCKSSVKLQLGETVDYCWVDEVTFRTMLINGEIISSKSPHFRRFI